MDGKVATMHLQRPLDPLRLRLLLEVQAQGSIVGAAKACMISQSSVSMHMQALEAALGQRLLERESRTTRLTEAGQVAARYAAQALDVLDRLQEELGRMRAGAAGAVSLCTCADFGISLLPGVLSEFSTLYPSVDVRVAIAPSAEVIRRVATGEAQIGVAGEMPATRGVSARHLMDDGLVGVAAPGTVTPAAGSLVPSDLRGLTVLVPSSGSSTRLAAERYLARAGFDPNKTCELDSVEAIKRAVRYGCGIAFVSRLAVRDELESGHLTPFELKGARTMDRPLVLVAREHHEPGPVELVLIETLVRHCEGQSEPDPGSQALAPAHAETLIA